MTPARVPVAVSLALSALACQADALAQVEPPDPPTVPVVPAAPAAPAPGSDAKPLPQPRQPPPISVGAGYIHQFTANTGGTGTVSADRVYASINSRTALTEDLTLTLAMGYELDLYHWGGTSNLGVSDPWGNVNLFGWQARASLRINPEWTASVGGIFAMAGEADADAGDSLYGGGIGSVAWTPDRNTMIGIGVLGVTQIENDPIIIPIPVLHWNFAPEWELSTIRRPPASPFVGVDVAWEPEGSKADVAFGVGWQQRRFRLGSSSNPLTDGGVGLDQTWAAFFSFGYDVLPAFRIDLVAGTVFYEELQLETSNGSVIGTDTVDPSAILGIFGTVSF
jgi:hypothetical protein